jgi:uncharacterized membrane protein YfcA
MSSHDSDSVLDVESIRSNRLGQLTNVQVRHIRRVGMGWLINAMFIAAIGGLLTYAVPVLAVRIAIAVVTVAVVLYMVSKSYDCALDTRKRQVAALRGRGRLLALEATAVPLGGRWGGIWGGDQGRQRCEIAGRTIWMPSSAIGLLSAGDVSVYLGPRSHVVVNVESANASAS